MLLGRRAVEPRQLDSGDGKVGANGIQQYLLKPGNTFAILSGKKTAWSTGRSSLWNNHGIFEMDQGSLRRAWRRDFKRMMAVA
jgi:hypothetical protein